MSQHQPFLWKAMVAGIAVILILGLGMTFTIRRFQSVLASQLALVHTDETRLTIVERLRWTGELIVSVGRGYLLSGDPVVLAKLHQSESAFDKSVLELGRTSLAPAEAALVAEVARSAAEFRRVQMDIIADRRLGTLPSVIDRFENDLLPLRRGLDNAMSRLVASAEASIEDVYRRAAADRSRVAKQLYLLLAVLVLSGLSITSFFARRFTRAHAIEEAALDTARRAVSARDELMGIVAHDLRNPLNAITMRAALLARAAESEDTRRHASSIESVAMRMEYLIKSMLDIAMMEAGRFSLTPAPCGARELIREAFEMFESLAGSKKIRLEQGDVETGLAIIGDRERVLQVLSNLLGNALKFTSPSGTVRLTVDRQGDTAIFAVSDTGPGVPRENIPHIFERFWKDEPPGKMGTGLGLFIAKGIIDAHGGRLWVESEPGHGSTFHFSLPVAEPGTLLPRAPAEPDRPTTRG